jgi:hypothetical protein
METKNTSLQLGKPQSQKHSPSAAILFDSPSPEACESRKVLSRVFHVVQINGSIRSLIKPLNIPKRSAEGVKSATLEAWKDWKDNKMIQEMIASNSSPVISH